MVESRGWWGSRGGRGLDVWGQGVVGVKRWWGSRGRRGLGGGWGSRGW